MGCIGEGKLFSSTKIIDFNCYFDNKRYNSKKVMKIKRPRPNTEHL